MHCIEILRAALDGNLRSVHQRRRAAIWRAATGVILGGQLWLTGIARWLPGTKSDKHRIKAVDRLLGNPALHREKNVVYRALAARVLRNIEKPVIAVDWTGAGAHHYEISAKLCSDGRALPLFSMIFPKKCLGNRRAHREFLRGMASVVPAHCRPVLMTDAGFHCDWFDDVTQLGWDYIGRVRGRTQAFLHDRWNTVQALFKLAGNRPKNLEPALLPKKRPAARRLVLSKRPKLRGRKRYTRRGTEGQRATDIKASKAAREPWLLATSLQSNPKFVVQCFALRMQIEESFRDRKSYRNGWRMHLAATRSAERMAVLCLLAALAAFAVQLVGRAVAHTTTAYQFQANTVRNRRTHSFFFLGCRAIQCSVEIGRKRLLRAFDETVNTIAVNAELVAEI